MRRTSLISKGLLALYVIASVGVQSGFAGELEDVKMPDKVELGGKELVLNGMGLRTVRRFGIPIDVYVAGLYVTEPTSKAQKIINSDQPRRILMQFVRRVDKEQLEEAWRTGLYQNCVAECDSYKPHMKKFNDQMTDALDGSQIIMDFYPDSVEVTMKGRSEKKAKVESAAFSKNLMAVFIGKKPPGKKFKQGLLEARGKKAASASGEKVEKSEAKKMNDKEASQKKPEAKMPNKEDAKKKQ